MGGMTNPDSVSLRINYTVPIRANEEATLFVRVKQKGVATAENQFGIAIEVLGRDLGTSKPWPLLFGPVAEFPAHIAGDFDKTFEIKVPCKKLNEDTGASYARDEILVRVKKTGTPAVTGDSDWVQSNVVKVYFGKDEVTPEP